MEADLFATQTGRRLNAFITIRWALTALGENDIPQRWTRTLDRLRHWANRRDIDIAFIWTHENPSSGWFNTHALVYLPRKLDEIEAWLVMQLDAQPCAIDVRPRTGPRGDPQGRLRYMLKGTDKGTAMRHGLLTPDGRWKARQGIVPFKRSGTSNNIGRTARARYARE